MSNDIIELREHLFSTLQALRDENNPMDLDRAKAVSDVAQTIINSAKVECEHAKITGKDSASNFLPDPGRAPAGAGVDTSRTAASWPRALPDA